MRHVAVLVIALTFVVPANASAQAPPAEDTVPASLARLQDAPLIRELTGPPSTGRGLPQGRGDSVGNGIAIGALAGAGAGIALVAWMYAQCDGTCDAPEPGPMYLSTAALGAGAGALVGWLVDAARKNDNRLRFSPVLTPQRKAVRVSVRF